uniref:C2H2-type domain-containing protein n=1 Tax=Alexandrium monilatum TaxID=311494 RepID=A0A7S4RK22_9DINO
MGAHQTSRPTRRVLAGCGAAALLAAWPASAAGRTSAEAVPRTELTHGCSRPISRNVRTLLESEVLKPAVRAGLEGWPARCPLDPARDLYGQHEKQKQRARVSGDLLWKCGICGKAFRNEHYLDLHLERRHMNATPAGGVCLADYCEVFEACFSDQKFRRRSHQAGQAACNHTILAGAKRRCNEAMTRCFPLQQEASRKLHAQLSRHWCQVLDCKIREERQREHHTDPMPVVVLIILIALVCFVVFFVVVCCVDYSDDILRFLLDSRVASAESVRSLFKARERARETIGMDRIKCI